MRIAVNTPSGHIGGRLAERLLAAGAEVAILSRHPGKVGDLVGRGARLVEGAIEDGAALESLFAEADAAFWLTPPHMEPGFRDWAREAAARAGRALRGAEVRRVVNLSSIGAQHREGTGPIAVLNRVEETLAESCPDLVHLRAGFFMENLLPMLPQALERGLVELPVSGDRRFPMVATRDIADRAADLLLDEGWSGRRTLGVHGPRDLGFDEVAAVLAEKLGRPVQYRRIAPERMREGLLAVGTPPAAADLIVEMYEGAERGLLRPAEPRTPESTTPTTLERFAERVLVPAAERLRRGGGPAGGSAEGPADGPAGDR